MALLFTAWVLVGCAGTPGTGSDIAEIPAELAQAIQWYTGAAGSVDDDRARTLLEQSAATGNTLSIMWMARVYSTGRMGFDRDKARAQAIADTVIGKVEALALAGNVQAMFLMGTAWAEGLGKPVAPGTAAVWYLRAAEQGHMLAQHNLGNIHASGTGVAQDDVLAVYWWRQAAQAGDAIPQFMLASMYELGRGVNMDQQQARYWYREASARGYQRATEALARLQP